MPGLASHFAASLMASFGGGASAPFDAVVTTFLISQLSSEGVSFATAVPFFLWYYYKEKKALQEEKDQEKDKTAAFGTTNA